nr:outer membrane beta-barrel protein [Sunxiuqinia sp.]
MIKDNNQLDDLFRSKLSDFEQEPPAYVWSRIREQQVGKKRRLVFFYLKGAGVAAAVLLAFLLGWQLQQQPKELAPVLTDHQVQSDKKFNQPESSDSATDTNEGTLPIQENASVEQPGGLAFAEGGREKTEADQPEAIDSNNVIKFQLTANEDASSHESQLETDSSENRNPETRQFQLLRLFHLELDDSFKEQAQLADLRKKQQETTSQLNVLEQKQMEENARLLAANRRMGKQPSGWQVGAMLTPGVSVSQSSQSQEYASSMAIPGSKDKLQMGGGISVEYKTQKRWSVQSGVYYSKLGQTSSNQAFRTEGLYSDVVSGETLRGEAAYFNTAVAVKSGEMLMNTAAGVVAIDRLPTNARLSSGFETLAADDGILLTQTEFEQNFEYIEIPLILRYQLLDATFDLQLLGGLNTSVLVGNNAYANSQYGNERIGETRDMNAVNYSTSFGFGLGYGLSDKISLRVEPQVKYFLGSLNSNANVNFKPYTIGIYTGLSYQF